MSDRDEIVQVIQTWGFARDEGDWEALARTFHPDGTITVSWFSGRFADFIEASREMRKTRRGGKHDIGGSRIEVCGNRALAETNVKIMGRRVLHGVECDSIAWGRFIDFFERRDRWAICRRAAVYEKDRIDPVVAGTPIAFDAERLAAMPAAYRFLAYSLSLGGFPVSNDLPTDDSPALEQLRRDGIAWLKGEDA